jgi:hypothetical protein
LGASFLPQARPQALADKRDHEHHCLYLAISVKGIELDPIKYTLVETVGLGAAPLVIWHMAISM